MEPKKRDTTGAYEPEVAPESQCTIKDTLDTLAESGQVTSFVAV